RSAFFLARPIFLATAPFRNCAVQQAARPRTKPSALSATHSAARAEDRALPSQQRSRSCGFAAARTVRGDTPNFLLKLVANELWLAKPLRSAISEIERWHIFSSVRSARARSSRLTRICVLTDCSDDSKTRWR